MKNTYVEYDATISTIVLFLMYWHDKY